MARMIRTIISIPADEKKWLDGYGKRHRMSSAEVVRKAVREFRTTHGEEGLRTGAAGAGAEFRMVAEGKAPYGPHEAPPIADARELRRRAIEAAGRFDSGVADLSTGHDRYLAEGHSDGPEKDGGTR